MTDVKHADVAEPEHNFKFYCQSENFAKIIGNRKLIFGTWGLINYIGQFILIVSVINVYSDQDRHKPCGIADLDSDMDKLSELYDMPLKLLGAYHIIEWVRVVIFLVTLLLGQNFLPIWYVTSLNTLFGIAVYITVHVVRYSGNGKECAEQQEFRAGMLTAEVIIFWVTFHIMSVPQVFLKFMSKENLEDALKEEVEEEEEGGK